MPFFRRKYLNGVVRENVCASELSACWAGPHMLCLERVRERSFEKRTVTEKESACRPCVALLVSVCVCAPSTNSKRQDTLLIVHPMNGSCVCSSVFECIEKLRPVAC